MIVARFRPTLAFVLCLQRLDQTSSFVVPKPSRMVSLRLDATDSNNNNDSLESTTESSTAAESSSSPTIIIYDDFLPQPNPEWDALQVVQACMNVLLERKDDNAGLEVCFNFSSDRCRAALGGSLEKFTQYASNPIFGYLVHCEDYDILSVGPVIQGTVTRGAMQTVLMDARQPQGNDDARRFLWTLQQERRPPRQGCWIIHEVMYVKNAYQLTV